MKKINRKISFWISHWYIWIFPLFAVLISIWLFKGFLDQRGPEVRITFEDVSSIDAEKTRVRFRGVTIGVVKSLSLSEDQRSAVAHVLLHKGAEAFTVQGSRYWVVSPKVGIQGVTGLETIFEGTYIAVQPGPPDGEYQKEFKGRLGSDINDSVENMSSYLLEATGVEGVGVGDAVTYRGMRVGSVTNVDLSKTGQTVLVRIHVQNKFVRLIRTNTVFNRKVAVQAKLGLFNSEIKVNSMDSILNGGVEFYTPNDAGAVAKANAKFILSGAPPKDADKWSPNLD